MPKIEPRVLRELLDYDPSSGILTWKRRDHRHFKGSSKHTPEVQARIWNDIWAGEPAFTACANGYHLGAVLGISMKAHRVIWAIVHSEWPEFVDHIDGNRSNNRIENLRSVTKAENQQNRKISSNNTSGHVGVYWRPDKGSWRASIGSDRQNLGSFRTREEAIAARKAAEVARGYHPNHGRKS